MTPAAARRHRRQTPCGTAQDFLRSQRPDAPSFLVLDVRLPGVSGLDFQRELADAGTRIPIIFITGHGDIPMSVGDEIRRVDFLTKPFRDQELLDAIHQALDRDQTSRTFTNSSAASPLRSAGEASTACTIQRHSDWLRPV